MKLILAALCLCAAVAASAVRIAVSAADFAVWSAATAASGRPRQAGMAPIKTVGAPGPGPSTGGRGWVTESAMRATGPCGI